MCGEMIDLAHQLFDESHMGSPSRLSDLKKRKKGLCLHRSAPTVFRHPGVFKSLQYSRFKFSLVKYASS